MLGSEGEGGYRSRNTVFESYMNVQANVIRKSRFY